MMYKNFDEWIKSNTNDAHTIIKHRIRDKEDRQSLEDTLVWCEHEIEQSHKLMGWLESATKEVCTEEQYQQIQKLYMTYMHNDFVMNCPWGREMFERGQIDAASTKIIMFPDDKE